MQRTFNEVVAESGSKPLAVLTGYDAPTARRLEAAGIDAILIGDSVGTNVLGYASELEVTLDDILHHTRAVRRGAPDCYLIADLPAGTYATTEQAVENAARLAEAGANGIKFEGPQPAIASALATAGFEPWGHLGFTPQTGGTPAVQGKTADRALELLDEAVAMATAGVVALILELVPEEVAAAITLALPVPTIGIGAGRQTTGQVQIVYDLIGQSPRQFRHARPLADLGAPFDQALREYLRLVREGRYLTEAQARHLAPAEAERFQALLSPRRGP